MKALLLQRKQEQQKDDEEEKKTVQQKVNCAILVDGRKSVLQSVVPKTRV